MKCKWTIDFQSLRDFGSLKIGLALALSASALILTGCAAAAPGAPPTQEAGGVGLANPAATYCQEQGYRSEIRTGADGGQFGVCIFADGSECDEWAFYRGECKPGVQAPTEAPTTAPTEAPTQPPTTAPTQAPAAGEEGQPVEGWTGVVLKQEPGDQLGPHFQRDDGERYSIGSSDAALSKQIAGLRGTGTQVKVWGRLFTGEHAGQARHIEVERLE